MIRVLAALLMVMAPAGAWAGHTPDPFPNPETILENVNFWKRVYTEWSLSQFVLHDSEHPALVYALFDLPGEHGETYTEAQRMFVRVCREAQEARLRTLETKVTTGEPLSDEEKELAFRITSTAGNDAIRGAHQRVRSQRGIRERFRRGVELSGRYDAAFREIFREAGLPEDLAYLPHVESSFQASARSSAGAVGIWQFTRPAARIFLTVNAAVDERLDPIAATRGASRYLARAFEILGDWALAVTSYNHGIEGMARAKERFGSDFDRIVREYDGRTFGFASRNFYASFLAAREVVRDADRFFPEGLRLEEPLRRERVVLKKATPAHALARQYGIPFKELASMNASWSRRALKGKVALPAGTEVWLPEGTLGRSASLIPATPR